MGRKMFLGPVRIDRIAVAHIGRLFLGAMLIIFGIAMPLRAQPAAVDGRGAGTTALIIELLKEKGVITSEEAGQFLERLRQEAADRRPGVRIVPEEGAREYLEQTAKGIAEQLNRDLDGLKQNTDAVIDNAVTRTRMLERRHDVLEAQVMEENNQKLQKMAWAQRIRFGGDVRLRFQADRFDADNAILVKPSSPEDVINTRNDRDRSLYRVRLSMKTTIVDPRVINVGKVDAEVRLATGNGTNPISTNDGFGDYFAKDDLLVDRAYLKWSYKPELPWWGDKFPKFSIAGGRIPNPFFSTDLLWDNDLNFEGLAVDFRSDTQEGAPLIYFFTGGVFPLQEVEMADGGDKYLYAIQVGVEGRPRYDLKTTLGLAYYDYSHIKGVVNPVTTPDINDYTAPLFQEKGNSLIDIDPSADSFKFALASDYTLFNITGALDYTAFLPIHLRLGVDYVKNFGWDSSEVARKTDKSVEYIEGLTGTEGYRLELFVGHPETINFGDWNVALQYKRLESDAVMDAFADSDFHLGGTNAKGWTVQTQFGIYSNVWMSFRYLTADEIKGPPVAIDTFQCDFNALF